MPRVKPSLLAAPPDFESPLPDGYPTMDALRQHGWLPTPRTGDRVLIGNTGAYTTCYSDRSAFNGYPAPAIKITRTAARPAVVHALNGMQPSEMAGIAGS